MPLQQVQSFKPWVNDGTVALASLGVDSNRWLEANNVTVSPTAAAWFEIPLGHAVDELHVQFSSEIQAAGGVAGAGVSYFGVCAVGVKRRSGVYTKPKIVTVAPPVAAGAGYRDFFLVALSNDFNQAFDVTPNNGTVMSASGLMHSGVAPAVGQTPTAGWMFSSRFVTAGTPAVALSEAFSVRDLETAWLAFAAYFPTGSWTGFPSTTFRTKAELEICTYRRRS